MPRRGLLIQADRESVSWLSPPQSILRFYSIPLGELGEPEAFNSGMTLERMES